MVQIKENAKLINEAIEAGIDPINVELSDAPSRTPKQGQGSWAAVPMNLSFPAHHTYSAFHLDLIVYN